MCLEHIWRLPEQRFCKGSKYPFDTSRYGYLLKIPFAPLEMSGQKEKQVEICNIAVILE